MPLAAAATAVALVLTLGGCAKQYGITDSKIGEGKALAHEVVDDVYAKLPADLIDQGVGRDGVYERNLPCGMSEEASGAEDASGSTQVTYGFGVLLTRQVSNDELEKLLTPDGPEWRHTKSEEHVESRRVIYDQENVQLHLELYGESKKPTIAFSGATACYNNGVSGISE